MSQPTPASPAADAAPPTPSTDTALLAGLQAVARRSHFLAELSAATQPLDEPAQVMQTSARMLAEHLDCDRCAYAEVEQEAVFVVTGDHARGVPSIVGRLPVASFGAACVQAMRSGRAYVVNDSHDDAQVTAADLPAYDATDIRAVVCVPLHKAGRFSAAMAVHQARPRHWSSDEIELVQLVTSRCWETLERGRVTRTLKDSEARMRAMVEATPECVKLLDAQGHVLEMNAAGLRMLEVPDEATVRGRCYYEFVAPEDRERFRAFNEAVCRGQPARLEFQVVGLRGTRRWMESNAVPMSVTSDGFHHLAVTRDVTERIDIDRVLAESRQRLADLNERLREQDRRKDEFLATLAHELRNPLAPIRTGLEVLRQGGPRSEQVREMMERQLTHLVRMVDDLLDISRITLDKVTLRRQPLDFREVLQSGLEAARPQVEAGGHALAVDLPDVPLPLDADPTRLAQVIANLLNNAAKYTPQGGRIGLQVQVEAGELVMQVTDTGMGIAPEVLPTVFELFAQSATSIEPHPSGLGLGLALVRRLVEMHGGSVQAHSAGPGEGSRFTVRLPLDVPLDLPAHEPQAVAAPSAPAPHPPAAATPPAAGPLRVLIVDDNVDAAETLSMLLEMDGHEVAMAHTGEDGVAAAVAQPPDVLLLDIGLPGIDGYEVARRLRADASLRPQPRIVALTGWGTDADRLKAQQAGMDAHLVKPVDPHALCAALRPPVTA